MSYIINEIRKANSITDYLASKGVHATKPGSDKSAYCCPLHEGDNTPSFFVHHKPDGEDFYCWGCKAGGNIIHLWAEMERRSVREAIQHFADDLDINVDDHLISSVENLLKGAFKEQEKKISSHDEEITSELFFVANRIRKFLDSVDRNEQEAEIADRSAMLAEEFARQGRLSELRELSKKLPSRFGQRAKEYKEKKKQEKLAQHNAWKQI